MTAHAGAGSSGATRVGATETVTTPPPGAGARAASGAGRYVDERLGLAKLAKKGLKKVFPDHWSFMLGEIALYSFIILLITGTFLSFFYRPSMVEVVYGGSYAPLRGLYMSDAFASTLELSFDVRGGLVMRQIHHWAALIFVAAMMVHMFRVFFTGAFRKPRELNWVIGALLLLLGVLEGFAGYSLPDDVLSGNGLRIAEGITRSIPLVGSWAVIFLFGGEFPGTDLLARLYIVHVLLIPGIMLALITAHLGLVAFHKHTQYPGPGRSETNVVGYPLMPVYIAKAGGFFFLVFGVTAAMGGLMTINPIWRYGPYNPSPVSAGAQPDWYMGFLEGALRLMPGWETTILGNTIPWNVLIPAVILPGIVFNVVLLYPFVEAWVTGDRREHHLADRPRNQPVRTALGVAGITFYLLLLAAGGNDILAIQFGLSLNALTYAFRVLVFVGPIIAFMVTKRICLGLQRHDRDRVLHGRETGVIMRLPHGEFVEVHEPVKPEEAFLLTQHTIQRPLALESETDETGVRRPGPHGLRKVRAALSRFYFDDRVEPPTPAQVKELESSGHH